MKVLNNNAIRNYIQSLVNSGALTCIGPNHLAANGTDGEHIYVVGSLDNLPDMVQTIKAYESAGKIKL